MQTTRQVFKRANGDQQAHSWIALFGQSLQRTYDKNRPIYTMGTPATELYVIMNGRVKVSLLSPQGREKILYLLGEGDVFGELSLINEERVEMAVACEPTTVEIMAIDRVRTLISRDGQWALRFLQLLCQRIGLLQEEIESQAFHSVKRRLKAAIVRLAVKFGIRRNGHIHLTGVTHEMLAQLLGVHRETVSHWMPSLANEHWISYRRGHISITESVLRDGSRSGRSRAEWSDVDAYHPSRRLDGPGRWPQRDARPVGSEEAASRYISSLCERKVT